MFMIPILLILIAVLFLFGLALFKKKAARNVAEIIGHLSLFALMWGLLGSTLGLIGAFDAIEGIGNISPAILAGGLKVSLLSTVFGLLCFTISRITMIVLVIKAQQEGETMK